MVADLRAAGNETPVSLKAISKIYSSNQDVLQPHCSALRSCRAFSTTRCRQPDCNETETLGHVLGFCRKGELLRNNSHHRVRGAIACLLRNKGWEVHEEVHCISEDDSHRRADIIAINRQQQKAIIIDPTIRMERELNQAYQVDQEKRAIYEPCNPYLSAKYNIPLFNWEELRLYFCQCYFINHKQYVDEVIGDHQCGFRRNRSIIDQIFYIRQILEKKREYKGTVHQLFIDFKKAYDSVKREVLYNILIEFGIPKKLVRLIKICLSETYSRVRIGQILSDAFPIHCGLKQGDSLSPLPFNFALKYAITKVQDNTESLELNGLH
ncbi:hypothetical protein ANN_05887 [Periplaneta americana]|uniref:Reverse transcriptase domain-containing protein n=1 Tax=Periplaneta americana TaxID=6978 RepID=A0ABQ8TCY2_PERAM|nr:hypothetical protein ANN_05887 [Periplaneta americana]